MEQPNRLQKRRKLLWRHALPCNCHKEHQSLKAEAPHHQGTGVLFAMEQPPSRDKSLQELGLVQVWDHWSISCSIAHSRARNTTKLWVPKQSSNYPAMWDLHSITLFPSEFVTAFSHHPHIGEEGKKVPAWKGRGGVEQEDPGAGYLWSIYSVSRRRLQ